MEPIVLLCLTSAVLLGVVLAAAFAGKSAHPLDQARLDELAEFVTTAQALLRVPGVSIGIVQGGKVVWSGGFGVRELGKRARWTPTPST